MNDPDYRRDLGDGLVLRWSQPDDVERVAAVVSEVFGSDERPSESDRKAVFQSFHPNYPHGGPNDWAIVEHLPTGQLVSATALMNQTWTYDGIPFGVGHPEAVVTRRAYRDRGLVRAIFELLHARSAARGQLIQTIDGIPFYYRQFGYEYALESFGGRRVYWSAVDAEKVAETDEPYCLRDATTEDIPQLTRLHMQEQSDSLVSAQVDETYWRWVLDRENGQDHTTDYGWRPLLIVDTQTNTSIGIVVLRDGYHWSDHNALAIISLATEASVPLRPIMPSVLRGLKRLLPTLSKPTAGDPPLRLLFLLGREHPVYNAIDANLVTPSRRPYAWYVRVPNLADFVTRIAPALERRLAASPFAGQSFSLDVSFYRGLLKLAFENGRLTTAEEHTSRRGLPPGETSGASVAMQRNQFVQLVFGYRSLEELRDTFPDVNIGDEQFHIVSALFPKRFSRPLLVS
jgi:hypothetical protein